VHRSLLASQWQMLMINARLRYDIPIAASMCSTVSCDIRTRNSKTARHSKGKYRLHLQGLRVNQTRNPQKQEPDYLSLRPKDRGNVMLKLYSIAREDIDKGMLIISLDMAGWRWSLIHWAIILYNFKANSDLICVGLLYIIFIQLLQLLLSSACLLVFKIFHSHLINTFNFSSRVTDLPLLATGNILSLLLHGHIYDYWLQKNYKFYLRCHLASECNRLRWMTMPKRLLARLSQHITWSHMTIKIFSADTK
jgi:hypothetical protein